MRGAASALLLICFAALSVVSAPGAAVARTDRSWAECLKSEVADVVLAFCTDVLDRGAREPMRKRAIAHVNRGWAFQEKGDQDSAIRDYDEAIRLDPRYALAYGNRGNAWREKGDVDRALRDLNESIRLNPHPTTYFNRGNAWRTKGDQDRAIRDYDEAIRLNPKLAGAFSNRGNAHFANGDVDRAIRDFDEAIRLNPGLAVGYNNRGWAHNTSGNLDRAIRDFEEAIRLNPRYAVAFSNLGEVYNKKGDFDRAIRNYDEAIRLDPRDSAVWNNRGKAYFNKGDHTRASHDFSEAIRLDPISTAAFANRGRVHEAEGDIEAARADFKAALALPQRGAAGRSAHDTARERLAALDADRPPAPTPPPPAAVSSPPARPSALAAAPGVSPPPLGRRVALVIGNSAYATVGGLPNARTDAQAVAAALRGLGFVKVALETDLTREAPLNVVRAFATEADGADWATVYFAGHGIEMNGANYIIPVDARLASDRDVEFEAVPLDRLMSAVDGARRLRLVMLDACRNNPFIAQMRRSVAQRSIGRGLAQVEPEAGTLVVFAAKHGQVALDGDGANSPFVTALVNRIKTPNLEVRRLFDLVRDDVMAATGRRQQPFSYGSVSGSEDFYFLAK